MPAKFRNLIFVKKGSLVIVEPVSHTFIGNGAQSKNKISHDICVILSPEQIRNLFKKELLPECFISDSMKQAKTSGYSNIQMENGFLKGPADVFDEDDFDLVPLNVCIHSHFLLSEKKGK